MSKLLQSKQTENFARIIVENNAFVNGNSQVKKRLTISDKKYLAIRQIQDTIRV